MTIRGKSNYIRALLGIQSFVLVLQVCVFACFQNQQEAILVASWSPQNLPFSTTTHCHPTIRDQKERIQSNRCHLSSPFSRPGVSLLSATSSSDDRGGDKGSEDDEAQFIEVESLTTSQVTELIELTFFQACFALSKGDIDPLKLFIVAIVTASKKYKGASATALALTVDALPPSMRPLESQERDLREIWIKAVYLMMGHVLEGFESEENDEVATTYGPVLVDLVAIHRTGMGLNVNQFVASRKDILLPKSNVLVLEDGPEDEDLVKLSVVTQTINVLYTTLLVLDEEYESADPSAGDEEEMLPTASPAWPAKKSKKKNGKKGSSGGKGFG